MSTMIGLSAHLSCFLGPVLVAGALLPSLRLRDYPDASSKVCSDLAARYNGSVLLSSSPDYIAEATDYWDRRSNLSPTCIFLPSSANEVSFALSTIDSNRAPFAIRGGGHMNYPGSNNIDNGVLVALERLNKLEIAPDRSVISVGPGNRWIDVYAELDKQGLYAIGGRLKSIGVPGLLLIGGVHYFANRYGYAMDNALRYDVVLGNGTQVRATAESHPDLFWALKGGANNFGVATEFEIKAYEIPVISTTIQEFDGSQVEAFIAAACSFAKNEDAGEGAGAVLNVNKNASTGELGATLWGAQESWDSPPSRFAEFDGIPALVRNSSVMRPLEWHDKFDTPSQMFRVQFGHHAVKPDPEQMQTLFGLWSEAVEEIADVPGLFPSFVLNVAPKTAAKVAKTNGIGNTWGLEDDQSYIWWQISTGWQNEEDDAKITHWSKELIERLHAMNVEKGLASEFLYMGDAGEYQNVFNGFPPENVDRMKAIRDLYDPDGLFTELNTGGFKLPM